ncbi:hypothetical protein A3A38_03665 [Candidatus Kaiserbacteria bacterium RIFCSPLOWO2_01_FULL_53_17]|uniref:Uncharacterized protein n=1 Tax=Candidatus Kaiserbacteria bacterium RIFCSPLOWO2_01_FULL_53_17 TaxID=1798511 RepID=A0A1F6EHE0_9BACT|nr:MAG: hypothetical protein A3A38_03665 [Candidatus Kaiserbacteria bacterium RIFCSPLOWO2_01_FULL_53_17]
MLAPELQNYLDSLKAKANTISDEQLRGMIKVAGWGEETFVEAIDYFRSPSAPPKTPAPSPEALELKKIVIPKSVLREMSQDAKAMNPTVTIDRRPGLFQWVLLLFFALAIPLSAFVALARTMPELFTGTQQLVTALVDVNALVALTPGLLVGLLGVIISLFIARRAYRTKGRPVISFLFGLCVHILFLIAAYVAIQWGIALFGEELPREGFAISLAISFAGSLYTLVFFTAFVLGTFFLLLSYMFPVPLQETFQHSAGGQVRVILFTLLLVAYLFNIAYFPALLTERKELCYLVFDNRVKSECFAQIAALESVKRAEPLELQSEDDQYYRDVQAL